MEELPKPELMRSENVLLPDPTPILKETPDEPPEELTNEEEQIKKLKEKAMMCKCISLSKMGFHPITTNGSYLHRNKKKELLERMTELFEKPLEEITKEFNEIICEELTTPDTDYGSLSVYKRSYKKKEKEWNESLENLNISV